MMQKFKMEIQEFNALFNEKYPRDDVLKQYTNPVINPSFRKRAPSSRSRRR